MELTLRNLPVRLLPSKGLWLETSATLIIADLHFGKVQHFRRAGLPMPPKASARNAELLIEVIQENAPREVIFLGDLFHSHYNEDWEVVGQIVKHFPSIKFQLVRGNHDIMSGLQYERKGIQVIQELRYGPLWLTHEPAESTDAINVAGHLHPGARLEGKGRQSVVLPCFWLRPHQLIIPAFGALTGCMAIRPDEHDRVFIVLNDKVMETENISTLNR